MAEEKAERGRTKINKDNVRALVDKLRAAKAPEADVRAPAGEPGAGRAPEAEVDVFSLALGPTEECLSSRQILRAVVVGVTDSEREHLLQCEPCIEHLSRISGVRLKSDGGFVKRMLARLEPKKRAETPPVAARVRYEPVEMRPAAFRAILATPSRVQKFNLRSPRTQVIKIDVVPLFDLGSYQIDPGSFELQGAFQSRTVGRVEEIDVNKDGKKDFITITFTAIRPSRSVAAAISSKRSIVETVRLVGHMKDGQKKSYEIIAQANLEFQGK